MTLFTSVEKPQGPSIDIDALRAEIQRLKEETRIRSKYGRDLSDDDVQLMIQQERRAAQAKENQKNNVINVAANQKKEMIAIFNQGNSLLSSGVLRVTISGEAVKAVSAGFAYPCPGCGSNIAVNPVYYFAEVWYQQGGNMQEILSCLMNGGNLANPAQGSRGLLFEIAGCPKCGKNHPVWAQLALVE